MAIKVCNIVLDMLTNKFVALLQVYFGTQHAFLYLFANTVGLVCANGMSTLYNKTVLDELGMYALLLKQLKHRPLA